MFPPASHPLSSTDAARDADAALIRRVGQRDKDALAELYDRYSRPLFAVALRILHDRSEAEDIVQDVFLSIWEKSASFDAARGAVLGWALTLTRNRAIDRLRLLRRRHELLDQALPADLGYGDPAPNSAHQAALREKTEAVRRAVSELSPEQRRTLELAFFGGLTQQEIAARTQEPLGTVKARIRRGLLKLRDTLAGRL